MFRKMRRCQQALSQEEIEDVLYRGSSGVLALSGDDDYPYAVPISYVYDGEKLFFHCAKSGHKLDAIQRKAKASFCVIDQDQIVPEAYTAYYRSVIAFGKIQVMKDERAMRAAIEKLAVKYAPADTADHRSAAIHREWQSLCMLEMSIDSITGKEAVELVKNKRINK